MKRGQSMKHRVLSVATLALAGVQYQTLAQAEQAPAADVPLKPSFRIYFDDTLRAEPASGRVVLYFMFDNASLGSRNPADGPFWQSPQPMYSVAVENMPPGRDGGVIIDDSAVFFPARLSELPEGYYRVQAVLDLHRHDSDWQREDGNLLTLPPFLAYMPGPDGLIADPELREQVRFPMDVSLDRQVVVAPIIEHPEMQVIEVRSDLLSDFHGRDVHLRGAAVRPILFSDDAQYAAVYEIPAFGGNHYDIIEYLKQLRLAPALQVPLRRNTWRILMDPESPNGHTLFADSANNGPVARAFVEEFIPEVERRLNIIPERDARLLLGHSSGAWSAIWLTLTHPETFGACWASAPDPVDFRSFQQADLYADANLYMDANGREIAAIRPTDERTNPMTVREENAIEQVLGPDNSSAQQWDSWQAVFGPRAAGGFPAEAWHPWTGVIDRQITRQWQPYDISALVRADPGTYGPIFAQRVHIVVGDQDTFFLNEAVERLRQELITSGHLPAPDRGGYIEIIPGEDHDSVGDWRWSLRHGREMADFLRDHGKMAFPME